MSRSSQHLTNQRIIESVSIALNEPKRTLKSIAKQIGMDYKTLSGAWYRRGIMLRDIRENGFHGSLAVIY